MRNNVIIMYPLKSKRETQEKQTLVPAIALSCILWRTPHSGLHYPSGRGGWA